MQAQRRCNFVQVLSASMGGGPGFQLRSSLTPRAWWLSLPLLPGTAEQQENKAVWMSYLYGREERSIKTEISFPKGCGSSTGS